VEGVSFLWKRAPPRYFENFFKRRGKNKTQKVGNFKKPKSQPFFFVLSSPTPSFIIIDILLYVCTYVFFFCSLRSPDTVVCVHSLTIDYLTHYFFVAAGQCKKRNLPLPPPYSYTRFHLRFFFFLRFRFSMFSIPISNFGACSS